MNEFDNSELSNSHCEACRIDAPKVSEEDIMDLLQCIPQWQRVTVVGVDQLQRIYTFENFANAIAFTLQVGDIAEAEGHHPALLTEWGKVSVSWWSHKIKGLHRNDFIMATKTDALFSKLKFDTDQ